MQYSELVQLYFERSNALQGYWTLYVVVIGGLLAFSSLRVRPDWVTVVLVTILYAFFAYKNLGAIHDVTRQRTATLEAIRAYPPSDAEGASGARAARSKLEPTLVQPGYSAIRNFHLVSDLLVIGAISAMEHRRIKHAVAIEK